MLVLPGLASLAGLIALLLPQGSPVRVLAGLALLLLSAFALARGFVDRRDAISDLATVMVLAVAIVAIVGSLLFDAVGVPLTGATWLVSFVVITWAACFYAPTRAGLTSRSRPGITRALALTLAVAALVTGAAIWLGIRTFPPPNGLTGYTVLWSRSIGHGQFSISVISRETGRVTYRLALSGKSLPSVSRTLELRPDQRYRLTVSVPGSRARQAEVSLFRVENGTARPYRRVDLVG